MRMPVEIDQMRVIVTGAQGWLGRFTVASLLNHPRTTVVGIGRSPRLNKFTYRLPNGTIAPLPHGMVDIQDNYDYVQCNLLDAKALHALLERFNPTHVIHLAGAIPCADKATLHRLNVEATQTLLNAIVMAAPKARVLFASSGSIYGEALCCPQEEVHPTNAATDYAKSKLATERLAIEFAKQHNIWLVSARIFNLVGSGTPDYLLPGSLAIQLAQAAKGIQPPVIHMGPLDTVRDYVNVGDCANAIVGLITSSLQEIECVNVASGIATPISEVWSILKDFAQKNGLSQVKTFELPAFANNVSVLVGSTSRLAELGIRVNTPLEKSLEELYLWALEAVSGENQANRSGCTTQIPI